MANLEILHYVWIMLLWSELDRLCAAGFIKKFATLDLCTEFLGCTPVVSKFGLVIEQKPSGIKRRRLVLDTRKNQRIILPHVLDVVFDALTVGSNGSPVEALVLDVSEAFWTLALRTLERRYFVGKLRGQYYCYLRLAQGSRGAPLAWGRFIALMGGFARAVVGTHASPLQIFVDDPILAVTGNVVELQEMIGLFIFVLRLVNLKACLSQRTVWPIS